MSAHKEYLEENRRAWIKEHNAWKKSLKGKCGYCGGKGTITIGPRLQNEVSGVQCFVCNGTGKEKSNV